MSVPPISRSEAFEQAEDLACNASSNDTIGELVTTRLTRRELLGGTAASGLAAMSVGLLAVDAMAPVAAQAKNATPSFAFPEVTAGVDERHWVAGGYDADVLIRWGDGVLADAPPFRPGRVDPAGQAKQFGYNNDFLGFFPLDGRSDRGLLVVNHEYTNEELMFPGIGRQDAGNRYPKGEPFAQMTRAMAEVELMAHGGTVIEIERKGGKWSVVTGSKYARRLTGETEMRLSGPAAGHARLRTKADPSGTAVRGMLNNCAGGVTPWGTWLTCEENVNGYFSGKLDSAHPEYANYRRMGIPGRWYNWGDYFDRFDVVKEPNEANRFGWIVEIDPFDPTSTPVKRTALGRFKHEGAAGTLAKDGRYVIYSGDDQRFDYVYKFVTAGRVNSTDRAANRDLLDSGTLYVARFEADGSGQWLALSHGQGPLTAANGFNTQADVVIEARRAADLLGATKMDRPEDIEVDPKTGKVYLSLTNNVRRKADQVDAANPRGPNNFGHIIELTVEAGDHAATTFKWEILVKCGDPSVAAVGATFNPATSKDGWFGMPDNVAFDALGRLWIATDGNSARATGRTDGIWAMETEGTARGTSKLFFRVPVGAEMCGPAFTPDLETFFVAVQHPGEGAGKEPKTLSTFDAPSTRWPDFKDGVPPRPAVVAITRKGGGKIAV